MKWRRISENEVMQTLSRPDKTVPLGQDKYHAYKIMGSRNIRVTYKRFAEDITVLTVGDKSD